MQLSSVKKEIIWRKKLHIFHNNVDTTFILCIEKRDESKAVSIDVCAKKKLIAWRTKFVIHKNIREDKKW